ncbi:hypothetical protein, partial [Escherichia coli]|uniref:hypothetical protein n=1 Tax=Escherichia coli TaxID=562 RepID=UPI001BFE01CD
IRDRDKVVGISKFFLSSRELNEKTHNESLRKRKMYKRKKNAPNPIIEQPAGASSTPPLTYKDRGRPAVIAPPPT